MTFKRGLLQTFSMLMLTFMTGASVYAGTLLDILSYIEKIYTNSGHQLTNLKNMKDLEGDLKNLSKQQLQTLEGYYQYGNLDNQLNPREWSPGTWQQALEGVAGHNQARYHALLQAYEASHPAVSTATFAKGSTQTQAKLYQQQVKVNRAVMVQSTYAYNNIQGHLQEIHRLSEQIDHAKTLKAAEDLNSRLIAELAYLEAQNIKLQTLSVEQQSESRAARLQGEAQTAKANTLTQ